ncbi:dTMP kinase [Jannaschia sp. CCS1]|uniref:Thymidylate kinase n=1 Tax=Jannaschia sp. (strain CCS1) TaxID=290400 RepID=KTHY_JANSC|nr:dTMP kinase [Jannaschia sp. CCS1]Q28SW8.1 RecName: Full=Thymidylate kinase; AltName: Full=dTMP kinase [Jannaschia sp. CCS1]ABD54194.1 thymidylate kinase [Jannaschia sp. CCS1]
MPPLFISLEGIDGSGKSTQTARLVDWLRVRGRDPLQTREPGGSEGAEEIRRLLVEGDPDRWSAETEILLFTAARRDHLERTIRPALASGRDVVTDRFADSTRVYQGATRGALRGLVDRIHAEAIEAEPDLTLILDMDPELALSRGLARDSGEDRFEDFGLPFQQKLRAGFQALAREYPDRCHIVDASADPDAIAHTIQTIVGQRLAEA